MSKECIGQLIVNGEKMPFSSAVRANGLLFISGQMPFDKNGQILSGNIEAHTTQTLKNLETVLQKAGAELADIVKMTIWITDAKDFGGLNKAYRSFFNESPPARSVVVSGLVLDAKVEIEAIALDPNTHQ